ncbi:Uncharacterised protein [Mycoplasmopsis californica]|uniref:Uncharacterized protein n=1 Tax=Mycoplasmopsis equigenitalium TaxID=114883 RepID=A0ABY5J0M8_9BACT|nr:hypothetical protein [Mycoplasmopsis equigenitalium]UUD36811.1 hypothetical protein NPA09_02850 [Mycoplasmopsis equigenitalium]VEU69891.1 Uncharacterised protein [Mycoplasmopsis californica]
MYDKKKLLIIFIINSLVVILLAIGLFAGVIALQIIQKKYGPVSIGLFVSMLVIVTVFRIVIVYFYQKQLAVYLANMYIETKKKIYRFLLWYITPLQFSSIIDEEILKVRHAHRTQVLSKTKDKSGDNQQ